MCGGPLARVQWPPPQTTQVNTMAVGGGVGAALGALVGGPPGALVGAIIGGIVGAAASNQNQNNPPAGMPQ